MLHEMEHAVEHAAGHGIIHSIEHALIDSIVIIPILLVTYVLMEWLEHKAKDKTLNVIRVSGKFGPIAGGLIGIIPQCGFSGAAASFYAAHSITLGTLIAIFMATSDEMLPIMISAAFSPVMIAKILVIKCIAAIACGYLVDLVYKRKPKIEAHHISDFCEQEHCECDKGIFGSAIKHTLSIFLLVVVVSAIINLFFEFAGESQLAYATIIWNQPVIGHLLSGLIGLIPNCSASVLLTNLYIEGVMSAGTMLTGLFVNAGVGLLVLFKVNHHLKENIAITGALYILGVVAGMVSGVFF